MLLKLSLKILNFKRMLLRSGCKKVLDLVPDYIPKYLHFYEQDSENEILYIRVQYMCKVVISHFYINYTF